MASSQSLENKNKKLLFIIFFLTIKKSWSWLSYTAAFIQEDEWLRKIQRGGIAERVQLPTL